MVRTITAGPISIAGFVLAVGLSHAPTEARCRAYCDSIMELCTGEDEYFEENSGGRAHCLKACAAYDKGGSEGDVVGNNTLHCRQSSVTRLVS